MMNAQPNHKRRRGTSLLELYAASAVFCLALSGLAPFTVMYLRQTASFEKRMNANTTYYFVPTSDLWLRKLGAAATISSSSTETFPSAPGPLVNAISIVSIDKPFVGDDITVNILVSTPGQ